MGVFVRNIVGRDLSVSGTVDSRSLGSGTNVSYSRNSCSVALSVGETLDADLSMGVESSSKTAHSWVGGHEIFCGWNRGCQFSRR